MKVLEGDGEVETVFSVVVRASGANHQLQLEVRDIPVQVQGHVINISMDAHFTGDKLIIVLVLAGDDKVSSKGRRRLNMRSVDLDVGGGGLGLDDCGLCEADIFDRFLDTCLVDSHGGAAGHCLHFVVD